MKRSSSTQSTSTASADNRAVADNGSTAITGNTGTVTVTDQGLVNAAFKYLEGADAANTERLTTLVEAAGGFMDKVQGQTDSVIQAIKAQPENASGQKAMLYALLGAAAIGLAMRMK